MGVMVRLVGGPLVRRSAEIVASDEFHHTKLEEGPLMGYWTHP